ncbi:MAG: hypothetical protein LBR91_00005 [Puniceicoccales bacterium]|jgi:hypothetical protein|nr:hypothetical protein [Puniceicoccales bacterium]
MGNKIAVICVVIAVVAFAYKFFKKRAAMRSVVSPRGGQSRVKVALKNLRMARAEIGDATFREFAILLSRALKIYIRSAYGFPALSTTSEEIVGKLIANGTNDWSVIGPVAEIFRLADAVKYSQRRISVLQQRGIYRKACRFILFSERSIVKNVRVPEENRTL